MNTQVLGDLRFIDPRCLRGPNCPEQPNTGLYVDHACMCAPSADRKIQLRQSRDCAYYATTFARSQAQILSKLISAVNSDGPLCPYGEPSRLLTFSAIVSRKAK